MNRLSIFLPIEIFLGVSPMSNVQGHFSCVCVVGSAEKQKNLITIRIFKFMVVDILDLILGFTK